jgi:hypothetical protein
MAAMIARETDKPMPMPPVFVVNAEHLGSSVSIFHQAPRRSTRLIQFGRRVFQPMQARTPIGDHRRDRLGDFMRD